MKQKFLFGFAIVIIVLLSNSCSKSSNSDNNVIDRGCGCNTDSIVHVFLNQEGTISFDSANYVGAQLPRGWYFSCASDSTYYATCGICNPGLKVFKSLTDTITKPTKSINVRMSGKITKLCSDENYGFHPIEWLSYHIIIDSINKK